MHSLRFQDLTLCFVLCEIICISRIMRLLLYSSWVSWPYIRFLKKSRYSNWRTRTNYLRLKPGYSTNFPRQGIILLKKTFMCAVQNQSLNGCKCVEQKFVVFQSFKTRVDEAETCKRFIGRLIISQYVNYSSQQSITQIYQHSSIQVPKWSFST